MEKQTIEMQFYPESVIANNAPYGESVESLEELEAYRDNCIKSYLEFRAKYDEEVKKWTRNGVVDYESWEKEDPVGCMDYGLAEFNGFNGIDMIEYDIEIKKQQDERRKTMHTQLFFYESDNNEKCFVLNDHLEDGYGVFVTPKMGDEDKVNYLLEVSELTESNHIDYGKPVPEPILRRVAEKLGCDIPDGISADGRLLREFISSQKGGTATLAAEKATSEFLCSLGVTYLCLEDGMIIMDGTLINVIRCEDEY